MNEPQTKLWIHIILATRGGRQLISNALESRMQNFFHDLFMEVGCPLRIANGMADHIHLLVLMNHRRSVGEVMRKVKGQSSRWINQNRLCIQKFAWEPGFAAFSVSESQVQKVFDYIAHQKDHHTRESFGEELKHITYLHNVTGAPGAASEISLSAGDSV